MQSSFFTSGNYATLACLLHSGLEFIHTKYILYIEADNMHSFIHLVDGGKIHSVTSLKQYEAVLKSSEFFRNHKRYIINTNKIVRYRKDLEALILTDGVELPLARSRKGDFLSSISAKATL